MSKTKGLGKDLNKSLETMSDLLDCLGKFSKISIKKGLRSNKAADEKIVKLVNEAKEKALVLSNTVEDLEDSIKGIKTNKNSRFAMQVVRKFLQDEIPSDL